MKAASFDKGYWHWSEKFLRDDDADEKEGKQVSFIVRNYPLICEKVYTAIICHPEYVR